MKGSVQRVANMYLAKQSNDALFFLETLDLDKLFATHLGWPVYASFLDGQAYVRGSLVLGQNVQARGDNLVIPYKCLVYPPNPAYVNNKRQEVEHVGEIQLSLHFQGQKMTLSLEGIT